MSHPSRKVAGIREAWRAELARREAEGTLGAAQETEQQYKVRENRLRRMATRQGLALKKSPRRDPRAIGQGTYMLVDLATNGIVAKSLPDGYGLSLDDIEHELTGGAER